MLKMKTEYIIKHKTKTRIYITKYYLSGFKKSTKWIKLKK